MLKIIAKSKLNDFITQLAQKFKVFIPVLDGSQFRFKEYSPSMMLTDDLSLYINTKIPPKEFLFPQKEILFIYSSGKDGYEIKDASLDTPQIIFGIRNCDARSYLVLDKFFSSRNLEDPYYIRRRSNTILIGLACLHPYSTCFCSSVGGGPTSKEGFDGFIVELENNFFYEAITPLGEKILESMTEFPTATVKQVHALEERMKKVPPTTTSQISLTDLEHTLDRIFKNPIWDSLNQQCIMCGSCSFLCPTCHCFDVQDEKTKTGGYRYRIWDSCQFPLFTQEASGHNPRKKGGDRTRQRIYHKFNYYPKNYNIFGCVGCGRCIRLCPMNHDLRSTLEKLLQLKKVT